MGAKDKILTDEERQGQLWCYPALYWNYFGPILNEAKTYSEFKMTCGLLGYSGYSCQADERNHLPSYDAFLLSESTSQRGKGIITKKAKEFWEHREKITKHKFCKSIEECI